jgi:hypothetical protein
MNSEIHNLDWAVPSPSISQVAQEPSDVHVFEILHSYFYKTV